MKAKLAVTQILIFSILSLFAFSGCGKKGPPVAPEVKGMKVAVPFDLKYVLEGSEIRLAWKHEVDKKSAEVKPWNFDVFMAKKSFKGCTGCPIKFVRIGSAAMPDMEFVFELQKGFKYYFRVRAAGKENTASDYSETVQIEYR